MERYFCKEDAVINYSEKIETTLELMANRYIGANPGFEYTARPFFPGEIIRNNDYRYSADFSEIFPDAPLYSYVYTWGKYRAGDDGFLLFTLIPAGPVKIWMNQIEIFATDVVTERYDNTPVSIKLPVKKGWNNLVLRFTRTKAGFGGEFGTWLGKLDYYFFRGMERENELLCENGLLIEGFDYTLPLTKTLDDISPKNLSTICLPLPSWTEEEKKQGVFARIFKNAACGDRSIARTRIFMSAAGSCRFSGTQSGNCEFFINEKSTGSFKNAGSYQFDYKLNAGANDLLVISECPASPDKWDFTFEVTSINDNTNANTNANLLPEIKNPFSLSAPVFPWIFAGLFKNTSTADLVKSFDREQLAGEQEEKTWWRIDKPGGWVRLYNENTLYGHWNYPLGVTLYGLIETARLFKNQKWESGSAINSYVTGHVSKSVRTLEYALFDKKHFGGATAVHHLLTSIDSLDDCGSFGSLVLEAAKDGKLPHSFGVTADYTADHILNKQDRLKEGCFYRRDLMHHFHNDTIWADDLYMSVPFLCRYAVFKNDPSIMDVAAVQFEGFKKYLYMEDKNLMAHVYDLKRNMNTGIPWGRGNGWTIFSLTELLMLLPMNHPRRISLICFFRQFASGILACQNENGMWHQVLDRKSSYIESSCTAMFISAFCRGIRYGWFEGDPVAYRLAAEKAWQALETFSIDRSGNLHGVCRGSEFSFNPNYYAEHLLPRLNDTHGIGIVLLAGVELLKTRNQ